MGFLGLKFVRGLLYQPIQMRTYKQKNATYYGGYQIFPESRVSIAYVSASSYKMSSLVPPIGRLFHYFRMATLQKLRVGMDPNCKMAYKA